MFCKNRARKHQGLRARNARTSKCRQWVPLLRGGRWHILLALGTGPGTARGPGGRRPWTHNRGWGQRSPWSFGLQDAAGPAGARSGSHAWTAPPADVLSLPDRHAFPWRCLDRTWLRVPPRDQGPQVCEGTSPNWGDSVAGPTPDTETPSGR
jgi:hypothetical protein